MKPIDLDMLRLADFFGRREGGGRALSRTRRARRTAIPTGMSLIEMMVGLAVGLLLVLGLATLFAWTSADFSEMMRGSRQIENGRYAMHLLTEDIHHAGFYGELFVYGTPPVGTISDQATPCASALATLVTLLPVPIQGVDYVPGTTDPAGTLPTCLPDHVSGTDVLVVRRARTSTLPAASAVANGYYTQSGFCATATPSFQLAQTGFAMTQKDCATTSPIRQFLTHIWFISPCSKGTGLGGACTGGDPQIPTLKRLELGPAGVFTLTPLVDGIENIQFEYGLDTAPVNGVSKSFTANPGVTGTLWGQVVAVRVHVLARNLDPSVGYTDVKTFNFGKKADGTDNNYTPGGAFKRHKYTELVRLVNVGQRREPAFGG